MNSRMNTCQQIANVRPIDYVLWLADNGMPAPEGLYLQPVYADVLLDMTGEILRKYEKWLRENHFWEDII